MNTDLLKTLADLHVEMKARNLEPEIARILQDALITEILFPGQWEHMDDLIALAKGVLHATQDA